MTANVIAIGRKKLVRLSRDNAQVICGSMVLQPREIATQKMLHTQVTSFGQKHMLLSAPPRGQREERYMICSWQCRVCDMADAGAGRGYRKAEHPR